MKRTLVIMRALLSLFGLVLIALGVLFWTGRALALIPLHMFLGMLFVVCLWILVGVAMRARSGMALAWVVLIWSLIVPVLGIEQLRLLPGAWHWVIQALHLVVGLIAIGLGHALARRIQRRISEAAPAP